MPQPAPGTKINFELASLLAFCKLGEAVTFPEGSLLYYADSLKNLPRDHGLPSDMLAASADYADSVGLAVMAWSKKDHYAETRGATEYMVNDSPGRWVPTPPAYTPAMEPHWREIRFLVVNSFCQIIPHPPHRFNVADKKSLFFREVKKIEPKED